MSRSETVAKALNDLEQLKKDVNKLLYYSEGEDLKKRENKKGGWSGLEIIYHINQVSGHYLQEIDRAAENLGPSSRSELKTSWLGRKMLASLGPLSKSKKAIRFKSPAKVDPLKLQEKGFAISEDVIFRELLKDLDTLEKHLKQLEEKNYDQQKIKTLISWLKVNAGEAQLLVLNHTQRHVEQIQKLLS